MDMLNLLLYWSLMTLCTGCQLPMQPVYNATSQRHISCNVWEPDCPTGSICQPAGVEWKRKLEIHPKYVLFLCCSGEYLQVDHSTDFGNIVAQELLQTEPSVTTEANTVDRTTAFEEYVIDDLFVTAPMLTSPADYETTEHADYWNVGNTQQSTPETATISNTIRFVTMPSTIKTTTTASTTSTRTSTEATTTTTTPTTTTSEPTTKTAPLSTTMTNYKAVTTDDDFWETIFVSIDTTPNLPVPLPSPDASLTPRPLSPFIPPLQPLNPDPLLPLQPLNPNPLPPLMPLEPNIPLFPPPTTTASSTAPSRPSTTPFPKFTIRPFTTTAHPHFTIRPVRPSSLPQPEYHFFIPQNPDRNQQENFYIYPTPPMIIGSDETDQAVLPPPIHPTPMLPFEPQWELGNGPIFTNMVSGYVRPKTLIPPTRNDNRGPLIQTALFPAQTTVFVPGNGFRRRPGAGVFILVVGEYETPAERNVNTFRYCGTVVLVQDSGLNILVDTGSANSKAKLLAALNKHGIKPSNIQLIIYTHPHPDHVGNDNLFMNAQKLLGHFLFKNDELLTLPSLQEASARVTANVEIWQSPGHTFQHNSVIIRNVSNEETNHGTVAITGDLFLNEHDSANPSQWMDIAEDRQIQSEMRDVILCEADFLIPGHGLPFPVTKSMKDEAMCAERRRRSKSKGAKYVHG